MPGNELVKSVGRALDILQVVGASDNGLGLAELAKALGANATTVHNLARTLVARGFLEKTERPVRYRIGAAFLEVARTARDSQFLDQAGLVMRELAGEHPDITWTLVQKSGPEFLVRWRMSPEQAGILQKPEHRAMSPFSSASALVFQAFLSTDELDPVYERYPFDDYGQPRWLTRGKFDAFLEDVRRKGYAMPESAEGRLILAVPVFSGERQITASLGAALACSGSGSAVLKKNILRKLLQAATRLGQAAGLDRGRRRGEE